jgi:hypothetical protein
MIRKLLLVILAVWASGSITLMQEVHAAATSTPQALSGGGRIDAIDIGDGRIIIDDSVLLLSPTTRVIDATGRPSNVQALRRGAMVNYSATWDRNAAARPKITEIAILSSGQKPRRNDD